MKVGDNDIGFLFNVRARINIAQMTDSKKIMDIGELFDVPEDEEVKNTYKIARILNDEYERARKRAAGIEFLPTEDQALIQIDDIYALQNAEYNELQNELISVLRGERTVEAEPAPGKKDKAKPSN